MSKIIGIDLGTTNSAVAVMSSSGNPEIVENKEGSRTTPSIVAISKTNERLVGVTAKRQSVTNPSNTIFGVKRFVGHRFADKVIQEDQKVSPFEIKKAQNEGILIKMNDKDYTPEELSSMVLKKLKEDTEERLGEKITEAVITVPAYFDDNQRKATKDAGKIAGLNVRRIINEPTAAALAYGFNKKKNEQIAVFDFGGGTFDISILEVGDDVVEVKSTDGDSHMGGRDIDRKIVNWIAGEFKKDSGINLLDDPLALQRLDEAAENAKKELSQTTETEINIPFITSDNSGPKHLLLKLTRATLEEMSKEYVDRAIEITKKAIEASPFEVGDIDEVILVGGQTRMPLIQERVKEVFKREPNKSINPDEVVALGAAIQGGILRGDVKDVLLLDVIPLSLGIETLGGVTTKLIDRNTTVPTSKTQVFSTAADNQTSVDINVLQGERSMSADNRSLGRFILEGITPASRGLPQIEVSFDIDANGILNVVAKDKQSNKEQSIKIEATSGLSDEDIEKMKSDAELHGEEDKKKAEVINQKNTAEQIIYTTEKFITENKDKLSDDIKKDLEGKIAAIRTSITTDNVDEIKKAVESLSASLQSAGESISKAQSDTSTSSETPTPKDDVKDAEVEDGGDKK